MRTQEVELDLAKIIELGQQDGLCKHCGAWLDEAIVIYTGGFAFQVRCRCCSNTNVINNP